MHLFVYSRYFCFDENIIQPCILLRIRKLSMNPVLIKCLSSTSFHISFFSVFDHHMKKVRCKSISMRLEGSMAKMDA